MQTRNFLSIYTNMYIHAGGQQRTGQLRMAGAVAVHDMLFNPFIPDFLKWTCSFLNLDLSTDANRGFSLK